MYLFRTTIPIVNGISGATSTTVGGFELPKDATIVDFKFLDEASLLILYNMKCMVVFSHLETACTTDTLITAPSGQSTKLLRVAHQSVCLSFSAHRKGTAPSVVEISASDLQRNTNKNLCMFFEFPKSAGFTPVQMEVERASKARGDLPNRVCLLGRGHAQYRNYALPEDWEFDMAGLELSGDGDMAMGESKPI